MTHSHAVLARPAAITSVTDSFTRANAGTLGTADTGQAWTALGGTWSIASNKATNADASGTFLATLDTGFANVDVAVDVTIKAGNSNPGLIWRSADINNHWHFTVSTSLYRVYKRVAGTYTQMSTHAGIATGTYRLRAVANGSAWAVYIDGVQVASGTDSALSSNTKCGIGSALLTSNSAGADFDNFAAIAA